MTRHQLVVGEQREELYRVEEVGLPGSILPAMQVNGPKYVSNPTRFLNPPTSSRVSIDAIVRSAMTGGEGTPIGPAAQTWGLGACADRDPP